MAYLRRKVQISNTTLKSITLIVKPYAHVLGRVINKCSVP